MEALLLDKKPPESLRLEQPIGFPLYREEQEPCTPHPATSIGGRSPQHMLHPTALPPAPPLHAKAEGESLLIQKHMFLPAFLIAMETALPSPLWPVMVLGQGGETPQAGRAFTHSFLRLHETT